MFPVFRSPLFISPLGERWGLTPITRTINPNVINYRYVDAHFVALVQELLPLPDGVQIFFVETADGAFEVFIAVLQGHLLEAFQVVALAATVTHHESEIEKQDQFQGLY